MEASDKTSKRGLFDGFEGYRTPSSSDYGTVLTAGLVAFDANVLLNLYRYTTEARDDLLAIMGALEDRLWVPNQVLVEFWRNREIVLQDPRDTNKTIEEIENIRDRARREIRTWVNRVSLPGEQTDELITALDAGFKTVVDQIDRFADSSAQGTARDTDNDDVLSALEGVLRGKVGPPLDDDALRAAHEEGLRRVEQRIPPGYMDKQKEDEGAAGDYMVWEQLLLEASERQCDVLFVTADAKEDWWRRESGESRGPRIELVNELRERCGSRLFMLRPPSLLIHAGPVLSITVREESAQNADTVDRLVAGIETLYGGWDDQSLDLLMKRLAEEAPVQAQVIKQAAGQGGFIDRDTVYAAGDYPASRSLRGFTRPVNRITQILLDEGHLSGDPAEVLSAVYHDDLPNPSMAAGFQLHPAVLQLLEGRGDTKPSSASS